MLKILLPEVPLQTMNIGRRLIIFAPISGEAKRFGALSLPVHSRMFRSHEFFLRLAFILLPTFPIKVS